MEYLTALAILCMSVACCFTQSTDTSKCPDAAKSNPVNSTLRVFGGSCLEFVPTKIYWQAAKADCMSRHGRLIEIRSAAMQNFTYQTQKALDASALGIWIGIDDIATQGTWLYSDSGDKPTYSNWAVAQPACFLTGELARLCIQDCGLMDMDEFGQWNDQYCHLAHLQYGYVCEYVLGGTAVTGASTAATPTAAPTTTVATPTPAVATPTPAVATPTPAVATPTPAVATPTPAVA